MKKLFFCVLLICVFVFGAQGRSWAQDDLELVIDLAANNTVALPKIFKPSVDLSGRGFHRDSVWPQTIAAKEAVEQWHKDIGPGGFYRIQYNLWGIHQFSRDKEAQADLLANYEGLIKNISDMGGTVILNIFGTPAGAGRLLEKASVPKDMKAFKRAVKGVIRELSCVKKYNIWYELWNAPDINDFFLGRTQDYLNMYSSAAEAVKELEAENNINIPLGGPSVSAWFRGVEENTIATPERSLIYELIKFCYSRKLPLDFISWHAYSSDPQVDLESTIYKKNVTALIRDWLTYFHLDSNLPLVVDEWSFDRDDNKAAERDEASFIAASYIPARLKYMHEAGVDGQAYFCLEDFKHNKEGVFRNIGVFSYDSERSVYKGRPKAVYSAFKALNWLEANLMPAKINDEFAGVIATRSKDGVALLIYNYIDPDAALNYISRNIAGLEGGERSVIINFIKSQKFKKLLVGQLDIAKLRVSARPKNILKKAQELDARAKKYLDIPRSLKLSIRNLKGDFVYRRFVMDSSCAYDCKLLPAEEKEIAAAEIYEEPLVLKPYSVELILLKAKPEEPAEKVVAVDVALEQAKQNSSDAEEKR